MTLCAALGATLLTPADAGAAGSRNEDAYRDLGSVTRLDWMANIADDTSLAAMSLPGTHDTLAIHGGAAAQTQEDFGDSAKTLKAQLERGIRAIDIRVRVSGGEKFTIHHGVVYQKANFDDVLSEAQSFLGKHPSETVVMRLRAECPFSNPGAAECANDPKSVDQEKARKIFSEYVGNYRDLFYGPSASGQGSIAAPTLEKVRGKLVLGGFDGFGSDKYGINTFYKNEEDHFSPSTVQQKWDYVKENIDRAAGSTANEMFVTYTSASKTILRLPFEYAGGYRQVQGGVTTEVQGVNHRLMKYLNNGGGNGRLGIVMMDFPGWALRDNIISRNDPYLVKGGDRAIWTVNSNKTYSNTEYRNRCMVRGPEFDSSKSGGVVTQRACQSPAPGSHQWESRKPSYKEGKDYFWVTANNGKCLTVPYNNGTPPSAGTQLFWWDCETRWFSGSQLWNVVPTKVETPGGVKTGYKFINNWTGLCLSMDRATASASGGKVTQDVCPK
ncbi:phosphatidylinositol-specific phospholipase C domain-containing protein [Streptomyces rimosus]|uniref:phosphatidylinositol-specific phospholipase C domain-containing protein n=1 Tax=Streptomyces rimosus TaxID=1927 RepID=UPI00067BDC35|nr:phosphatidylinositol-specific phospholipase C domain-containing protein [Streptomyces rimosus]